MNTWWENIPERRETTEAKASRWSFQRFWKNSKEANEVRAEWGL